MSGSVAAIGCAAFLTLVAIGTAQAADVLSNANAAYKAGDMVTAIRLYREFLADHPDAAEIRSNLGAARGFQTRPYPGPGRRRASGAACVPPPGAARSPPAQARTRRDERLELPALARLVRGVRGGRGEAGEAAHVR